MVLGREVLVIWSETLVISLAYYFTYRRFVSLSREVIIRLEQEGALPREPNPLGLPRHTVRILIILTLVALGAYLYNEGRLLEKQVITIFGTALSYLLGVFISAFTAWWSKGRKTLATHFWEDIKAGAVLLVVGATAVLHFLSGPDKMPHWLETTTVGLVLFYFGSR